MNERVLVTGGGGFIGSALTEGLRTSGIPYKTLDGKIDSSLDIEDVSKLLEGCEYVVHLAGKTRGGKEDLKEGNVDTSRLLLEAISKMVEKPVFIFSSSFAVYSVQDKLLTEKSDTLPRNLYGKSKLAAEKLIKDYVSNFNFSAMIFRISNVYGPHMPPYSHSVISTFMDQAIKDIALTVSSDGRQERDFVYIADVVRAFIIALSWKGRGGRVETLNICSGEPVSINQVVQEIGRVVGKEGKIIYPDSHQVDQGVWIGSCKKAKKVLGWSPLVGFSEGIKLCYEEEKK